MAENTKKIAQIKEVLRERFDEVVRFRESLSQESDRGCALLSASYLEVELGNLLLRSFIEDPKVAQEIIEPSRPLGSFSARIDMAYLIGLVGPVVHRDLHLIRKIRNEFGHNAGPITFKDQSIANRCREMQLTYHDSSADPRKIFTSSVLGVTARLHVAQYKARHTSPADESVPLDWTETEMTAFADKLIHDLFGA